jgi:hypothetical protein
VLEPREYSDMSDSELFDFIKNELHVNEANADNEYFHKRSAEYLERAIYVCPKCALSTFESENIYTYTITATGIEKSTSKVDVHTVVGIKAFLATI